MDTTFMNSEDSKTSDLHRLLLNLADKINLQGSDKYVALTNLSIYYKWKNIKKLCKNNKLSSGNGMKCLNYLMDHILYQIFKINLNTFIKMRQLLIILWWWYM